MKQRTIRTILTRLLLATLVVSCLTLSVRAEERSYQIDSAEFNLQVNPDGSVYVVETWEVTYLQGSYSRWRKEIYTDLGYAEEFARISNIAVKVDGEYCRMDECLANAEAQALVQADACEASCSSDGDIFTIAAYFPVSGGTHTYEFSYLLEDVVKRNADGECYFTYRLVGQNHEDVIKEIVARVDSPEPGGILSTDANKGEDSVTVAGACFLTEDSTGLYIITVKLDPAQVPGAEDISYQEKQEEEEAVVSWSLITIFVLIPAALLIVYLFQRKLRGTMLLRNPASVGKALARWQGKAAPMEIAFAILGNRPLNILGVLAELCAIGLVRFDTSGLVIFFRTDAEGLKDYQKAVLEILETTRRRAEESDSLPEGELEGYQAVRQADLNQMVLKDTPDAVDRLLEQIHTSLDSRVWHLKNGENARQFRKDISLLKIYLKDVDGYVNVPFEQMLRTVREGRLDTLTLLRYLRQQTVRVPEEEYAAYRGFAQMGAALFIQAAARSYTGGNDSGDRNHINHSGFSGGGGGCGGCGGCGGD